MRTMENRTHGGTTGLVLALLSCVATLVLAVALAAPSVALAADANAIAVSQSFTTSGSVPKDPSDRFTYQLTRTDSASPLPADASGDTYTFGITGDATTYLPLRADGGAAAAGALTYSRVGEYKYELRCSTDASGVGGLTVDGKVYSVRVAIENDGTSGLKVGWVEVKNLSAQGDDNPKPDKVSFEHSYAGGTAPTPEEPKPRLTILGVKLPKTGDAIWGLIQLSGMLCVIGIVTVVLGVSSRRRKRGESPRS